MRIAVIGAGAMGSITADIFPQHNDVSLSRYSYEK